MDTSVTVTTEETLDVRSAQINQCRAEAYANQLSQAERMVKRSRVDFKPGEPGDNVPVPIPFIGHGRGDPRNILGVIVHQHLETDIYKIAIKAGVLNGGFSRNQFDLCPQKLLTEEDVSLDKSVSLRSAVIAQSASGGQGFTKYNCSGPQKCQTKCCKCFKAKIMCNSRCHGSHMFKQMNQD